MSDSTFNPNEINEANELNETIKAEEVAETPVSPAPAEAEQTAETAAEEAPAEAKKPAAQHMTASAATLNADGEVDIRRQKPRKETKMKKARISYERKKGLYGYGFLALWIVGTLYMFIIPLFQSIWYSLCFTDLVSDKAKMEQYGMSAPGIYTEWNNFKNYSDAFLTDQKFLPNLTTSLGEMLPKTAMILVFSLFVALLLNQKFKGRTLCRAIFFLPVLVATGPVLAVINGDMLSQGISDASQFSSLFKADLVDELLEFLGMNNVSQQLTQTIQSLTSDILNLVWSSGIQILIFLSALQGVPVAAKEAAQMEGATGWEFFWKITFPTISPMILANLIYTVIDFFVDSENPVMQQVMAQATAWNHGFSAALAWIYFVIVAAALGIIMAIASRFVFYQVD